MRKPKKKPKAASECRSKNVLIVSTGAELSQATTAETYVSRGLNISNAEENSLCRPYCQHENETDIKSREKLCLLLEDLGAHQTKEEHTIVLPAYTTEDALDNQSDKLPHSRSAPLVVFQESSDIVRTC